jgi:hypothetical protein
MKLATLFAAVLIVYSLGLTLYAQEATGPRPKRARVAEDYQPGTLKELAAKATNQSKDETMVIDPDLAPTRVRATYAGLTARTPEAKEKLIAEWARRYAGAPETYTRTYEVDVAFTENGSDYWLTFKKKTLTSFWNSKWNKPVDLFVIKMGAIKRGDNWVPVLLVDSFQEAK